MELSYRLSKICEKITLDSIADIGTDHAYIPIFLCKSSKIKKAIACDISKGSLEKAKYNINKYNLQKNIQIRLSNGLEKITVQDSINTIVISGMGGMLIIDILEKGKNILNTVKEIVLQPQKDIDKVRKYLHKNSFKIVDDEMLKDYGKYYTIIKAIKGNECIPYKKEEYLFGKFEIENKCNVLKEYIQDKLYKMEMVLKNLENNEAKNHIFQIKNNIELYEEVLKCL